MRYSNTTLVKVKLSPDFVLYVFKTIQIQHLLKLNIKKFLDMAKKPNSNTTLVKVKYNTKIGSQKKQKFKYNTC